MPDTDDEIRARLHRMVEEDERGKEAAELLRHMVAFYGPFDRQLLTIIAPKQMSRQTRMNAFITLIKWEILERRLIEQEHSRWPNYHQWFLKPDIFRVVDVKEAVYKTLRLHSSQIFYMGYLSRYDLVYNPTWLQLLVETFKTDRTSGLKFFLFFKPFRSYDRAAQETAYAVSLAYKDSKEFLRSLMYLAALSEIYDLAWLPTHRYDIFAKRRTNEDSFQSLLDNQADLSYVRDEEKAFVEQTYDSSILKYSQRNSWGFSAVRIRLRLSVVKLEQDNVLQAEQHYKNALSVFRFNRDQNIERLDQARVAQALGKISTARLLYTQLYILRNDVEALWYWGLMEYYQGERKGGIVLCRLALHEWHIVIENYTNRNKASLVKHRWQQKRDELTVMEREDC